MTTPEQQPFKQALSAEDLVLPGECPASLEEIRATLRCQHEPANATESILVNEVAEQFWRLRRMRAVEARGMQQESIDSSLETGLLAFVARSMAAAERGLHRAITTLRKLQADRGFVPSKTAQPVSAPVGSSQPSTPSPQDKLDLQEQPDSAISMSQASSQTTMKICTPSFFRISPTSNRCENAS